LLIVYEYVVVKNLKYSIVFLICLLTVNFLITVLFVITRLLFFVCPEAFDFNISCGNVDYESIRECISILFPEMYIRYIHSFHSERI
jgi:hypothetical protein